MIRLIAIAFSLVLLGGCINSYEEEYKAALQELEATKRELAVVREKLKAADNETRHKVFTVARRINTHIQVRDLDLSTLTQLSQEMGVHFDSYTQMNNTPGLTGVVAQFYRDKVEQIVHLRREALSAYDRQYNTCLSDLDAKGGKNQLSTMLCEVQADVAKEDLDKNLQATIKALQTVGTKLLKSRGETGPTATINQIEGEFQAAHSKALKDLQSA